VRDNSARGLANIGQATSARFGTAVAYTEGSPKPLRLRTSIRKTEFLMTAGSTTSLTELIDALSRPAAYPWDVGQVEVRQTHISVVFLAGPWVIKIKKPMRLPFLDFSTLERRQFFCKEEVRLNQRLAPGVYHGIVPITRSSAGICIQGDGPVVEWAVQMERLPDEATFDSRLQRDDLTAEPVQRLARRVSEFHQSARRDRLTATHGRFHLVAAAVRENLEFARTQVGLTISQPVFERLRAATEQALDHAQPIIQRRAEAGFVRELHGDLHLDHVYLFEEQPPPRDLLIIDAIEFNEGFRCVDVVADMAFCVMDFAAHGRRDLGRLFAETYFAAAGDAEGRDLLPLFTSYRAAVRAKVNGMLAKESEVAPADRQAAIDRATAFWLLALGELESPAKRPALLLVSGLSGTGKSTLARGLAERAGFRVIRSDVVRKELAGLTATTNSSAEFQQGIYSVAWTDRTYGECLRQATAALLNGERVIVDATFLEDHRRREFLQASIRLGVSALWLVCEASPECIRSRLATRHGDASDADWSVYQQTAQRWESSSAICRQFERRISTESSAEQSLTNTLQVLAAEELGRGSVV
jgi:aminoglycoside phosphotransferase family enzyme/predicted kinase